MSTVTAGISVHDLHKRLHEKNEFALLDVREQEEFSRSHILLACCVPLSRLELSVEALVPCKKTAVFVMDDGRSQDLDRSARAAAALTGMGYQDVSIVTGGLEAWEAAGFVTVNGVGALSKGFGEYVEEVQHTTRLNPEEIKALLDDPDERTIVIDVRPVNEYRNMNIPGSTNLPGCEVTYRLAEVVKDPDTTIIINCAGRTRSIIGTQTLINAGIPNRVVALKGGTMNWQLSGFDLEYGSPRPVPPSTEEGRRVAAQRIRQVAETYHVRFVEPRTVAEWQADAANRTLYLFDVRQPQEYAAGHIPGAVSAQGGQLVQATDEYAAVRNGRYVLMDDDELRAIMTAHWLQQMGLPEVFVLRGGIAAAAGILGDLAATEADHREEGVVPGGIEAAEAARMLEDEPGILCLNVGASNRHREQHVPAAKWVVRSFLPRVRAQYPDAGHILLTADQEKLAALAAQDAQKLWPEARIDFIRGGTPAWMRAGLPFATGMPCALCPEDDIWYRPYTDIHASKASMQGYFDWEFGLVEKINADGCVAFDVKQR